ncbi:hypothetical protein ACHAO8_000578 [Botrytis cinerea]
MSVLTAPACSVFAASLLRKKTLELKSKIGNGHGTPVDAHDVMMAKYLHDSISIFHKAKPTRNLKHVHCMLQARFRGIISQLIVPGCEKTKHEYQGEEHNYKRDVGAQTSAEEHETNERHDDGVVSLSGIIFLAQSTGHRDPVDGRGVGGGYAVQRIVEKSEVDPVHAEDYEDGEGEAVTEYEFADSGDGHGDAAEHVEGSADGDEGGGGGALEGEEREDGGGEGDEEAEEAEEGGISWMGLVGWDWGGEKEKEKEK